MFELKKHVILHREKIKLKTMKKIALTILLALFATASFSQSIKLFYEGEEVSDTLNIFVNRINDESTFWLSVKNNASDSLYITVSKEVLSELPDSYNTFCLGNCYDPSVMVSPSTLNLAAGESSTNDQFHFVYYPANQYGTTSVKYSFYDERINEIPRQIVVNYITGEVGIDEPVTAKLFNAYPNPATSNVTIQYDLSARSSGDNAQIVLTSLVGNRVIVQPLNNASGKSTIDLSNLVAGIYFYSLEVNGQAISTKKLIVK